MTKYKNTFIKNIYYMLCYAFTNLTEDGFEEIAKEEFTSIHNLFAAILSKGIGRQLKQGLYREYKNHSESIMAVRGKIDMPGTIKNRLARKKEIHCEFDELSENNLLNQILKTTVNLLIKHSDVDKEYKDILKKEMLYFTDINEIKPNTIPWSTIRFHRNNNTYRILIGICQLILEDMLITTDSGEYRLETFIDDQRMERLYEKFILEYYKKECPQVKAAASQIPWALEDGDDGLLPIMQTDVTLTQGNNVLIIDAKFYTNIFNERFETFYSFNSNNIYQIHTYVKNKEAEFKDEPHTVSGVLLYAATGEDKQPDSTYTLSGNKISITTLDLNKDFSEIKEQLDSIIEEYFE